MVDTGSPSSDQAGDWPAQAAETIERLVGTVRDKTTGPALKAARAVVYGVIIAVLGVMALIVLAVALVRFVDAYLPGEVWSAHLLIGGLFTSVGLILWSRRKVTPADN